MKKQINQQQKENLTYQEQNKKLTRCKVDYYKIDYDLQCLYKVTNQQPKIFKTLPLQELNANLVTSFFLLMKKFQCENVSIYYENNYDIIKLVNLTFNEGCNLNGEELFFLKNFFISLSNILVLLFDRYVKPAINIDNDKNSGNNINNSLNSGQKVRVLN